MQVDPGDDGSMTSMTAASGSVHARARVRTAPSNSSMNERERLIKAALTAGGAAAAAS